MKVTHTAVYGGAGEGANMDKGRMPHRVIWGGAHPVCIATNCMQVKVKEKNGKTTEKINSE